MKILFASLIEINSVYEHGLYSDLMREFARNGHDVTILSPVERRTGRKGKVVFEENVTIIKIRIGNIQKTNYIEKGISTLLLSAQLLRELRKHRRELDFDLILYATPPVTIFPFIKKIKRLTNAKTVLMLKDIWPQEMVDLGLIPNKGLLYNYFAALERKLYNISDYIGYTSIANKQYLINHNVYEDKLVAVNNSVDPNYRNDSTFDRTNLLKELGVDHGQTIFFYGGNLGKPQDVDFIIKCLDTQLNMSDRFFVLCGQGTEYDKLDNYFKTEKPRNMRLFSFLPKEEYDQLIMASDVGLVFLNHRFTVPNCPSRFYTYMEYSKPVFACTDRATDISEDIIKGDFGWWCESTDETAFSQIIDTICIENKEDLSDKGKRARHYLEEYYTVEKDYQRIVDCVLTSYLKGNG